MQLSGINLIGACEDKGGPGGFHGVEAASGKRLEPAYGVADEALVDRACALAEAALDPYRALDLEHRAAFLERIGTEIAAIGDDLIVRAMAETGLPRGRLEGERGRTIGQLALFARVVREGGFLDLRIDPALPERKPMARPDLRLRQIPIGPVAVFGASNFPLAFSVAGGDTASALAAGCPVVVKAHPAHPGTSELVGRAIARAVAACGLPEGVFSLLFDDGIAIGSALVADRRIAAVGFTGSRSGGLALMRIAAARPVPIPVYAEMSSINPVILLPGALAARGAAIASAFVGSLTLGAGQFCTNPGLLLAVEGPDLDAFLGTAASVLEAAPAAVMLTDGIARAYRAGVELLVEHPATRVVGVGRPAAEHTAQAALVTATAVDFLADPRLAHEVFGSAALVVRCRDLAELERVLASLEGQLTAALHFDAVDHDAARRLMPLLERKVGRILANGFGTGVEVADAMVHGGPFPATSDGRTTSVGSLAIDRFLRPVSYQDLPDALLPAELHREGGPDLPRRVDGRAILPVRD